MKLTRQTYRRINQAFFIISLTSSMFMFQNCSNGFKPSSFTDLGSQGGAGFKPVITLTNPVPDLSNQRNLSLEFNVVTELGTLVSNATCQLDNNPVVDCSNLRANFTNIPDGDHSLKIDASDSIGRVADTLNVLFRIDATAPTLQFSQAPSGTVGSTSANISFTGNDNLSGIQRFECSLNNAAFSNCTSPVALSNLASQAHSFRVRAVDLAQNTSSIITAQWTVNTSAPTLNITSQPQSFSNSTSANFAFSGSASGTAMTIFECRIDTQNFTPCNTGSQNYTNLSNGSHTFQVQGRTTNGTMSSPVSYTWTVDNVAPNLPSLASNVTSQTQLTTATLTFSSTDATSGIANYQCSLNNAAFANCTSPRQLTNLQNGAQSFRVQAIDRAGNISAIASTNWTVDTIAPEVRFTQTPSNSTNTSATFAFVTSDSGTGIATVQCALNASTYSSCTSPLDVTGVEGSNTFRVQATDRAGNITTQTVSWTIGASNPTEYPIMFATVVPNVGIETQLGTFANHGTLPRDAIAGGDLFIRYPDGHLRNLTQEAGWGVPSGQIQGGPTAIAVREPTVHWSGQKAIFSMLVGGATQRYQVPTRRWQLYEVTGLGRNDTAVITKVANQPANYNNMSPIYGSNDEIFYTSDAPLFGMAHTYPQLDEYESMPTNTGIWRLTPSTGEVKQIQHTPSGSFDLFLDSAGRIIFTRWDHLKRDQQADWDRQGRYYGSFDFASEAANAPRLVSPERDAQGRYIADERGVLYDLFPEARIPQDRSRRLNESYHDFNKFTPWMLNQDGSEEETVNHLGNDEIFRHYKERAFTDDPNLRNVLPNFSANRMILSGDGGLFQMKEDINNPGRFLGVYALEFGRHASGRVIEINMGVGVNPEDMIVTDYTNETIDQNPEGTSPRLPSQTGHYRNPLRTSDGSILVSHTPEHRVNRDEGTGTTRRPRYVFLIKKMIPNPNGTDMIGGASLTGGIVKDIRYWLDDATPHQYNGPLSEVNIVEVRPRNRPPRTQMHVAQVEKTVFQEEGVDENTFRNWLINNNAALIISRNVTLRDRADITQPFNLRIPGGVSNIPASGKIYDISALQIFQANLTRAYDIMNARGRRVYAKPVHNSANHPNIQTFYSQTDGKTPLSPDGSMAAVVPAGRALTWQLISPDGTPVVRERYWVNFAAGEIRTCGSCHGINKVSHNGLLEPENKPEALRNILRQWKTNWWNLTP